VRTNILRRAKALADKFAAPRFAVRAAADDESADLYIYDQIGGDWFSEGITPKMVADALAEAKGAKTLNVYINSPGGNVFDGVAIYNEIRRFDARKVVHVDGVAASAASMIAMAGDEIVMAHNATMMIHEPWGLAIGNADEMRATADLLDKISDDAVLESYSRTEQPKEQLKEWMKAETWMNASEAVERKFADRVTGPKKKEEKKEEGAAAHAALGLKAALENPRDFERQLRDGAGLSQAAAKILTAEAKAHATREVDDEALIAAMERFQHTLTAA
jgi:ATP-dependent Clp protease protease subunit